MSYFKRFNPKYYSVELQSRLKNKAEFVSPVTRQKRAIKRAPHQNLSEGNVHELVTQL